MDKVEVLSEGEEKSIPTTSNSDTKEARSDFYFENKLFTYTLQLHQKRFYFDVLKVVGGIFLKITQSVVSWPKVRISITPNALEELRNKLLNMIEVYNKLPPHNSNKGGNGRRIQSRVRSFYFIDSNRHFDVSLRENHHGRFLHITMTTETQESQISFPAAQLEKFKAALDSVDGFLKQSKENLQEFQENVKELLKPHSVRSPKSKYYFDVENFTHHVEMRISEVTPKYRMAITIPDTVWSQFFDYFQRTTDVLDKIKKATLEHNQEECVNGNLVDGTPDGDTALTDLVQRITLE